MALKYYDCIRDFNEIAALAIVEANHHLGISSNKSAQHITHPSTLLLWFRIFRNTDHFPNSYKLRSKKANMPFFLSSNPDISKEILDFCKANLCDLTIELLYSHIHDVVLPNLVKKIQTERGDPLYDLQQMKNEFNIKKLTMPTIHRWMQHLGLKYETRKKCYYVDNHDNPEIVWYRNHFIDRYFNYELRCYRWYCVPVEQKNEMVKKGEIHPELGYHHFRQEDGKEYVEYHVDDHYTFQEKCNHLPYGGHLSVRKAPNCKPLMILGQDEVIFKQFLFSKGVWIMPDGSKSLIPKDDGQGVMISSFVAHEIG